MRHAKSDWGAGAPSDHQRPLNRRGRRAAETMGRLLAGIGEVPELAISSSAIRARRTVEIAAASGEWDTEIEVTDDLYGTSPHGALAVIATAPDEVERLMVVGHEPSWSGLVHRLTGAAVQMKTATVAIIDVYTGRSWTGAGRLQGEIVTVLQPRHFADGGAAIGPE